MIRTLWDFIRTLSFSIEVHPKCLGEYTEDRKEELKCFRCFSFEECVVRTKIKENHDAMQIRLPS